MKMIWLNGKLFYSPAFFFALGFKDLSTILCDLTHKQAPKYTLARELKRTKSKPAYLLALKGR